MVFGLAMLGQYVPLSLPEKKQNILNQVLAKLSSRQPQVSVSKDHALTIRNLSQANHSGWFVASLNNACNRGSLCSGTRAGKQRLRGRPFCTSFTMWTSSWRILCAWLVSLFGDNMHTVERNRFT